MADASMVKSFDVIVAGGGLSGLLAAARLVASKPGTKVAVFEREAVLGGRLRGTVSEQRLYSYGLNSLSDPLYDLLDQTLKADPDAPDLAATISGRQSKFGVLAGNRIVEAEISQWFTPKGARTLGGLTAQRQWGDVEEIVRKGAEVASVVEDDEDVEAGTADDVAATTDKHAAKSHAFSHYWKKPRKVPAAIVLEHFGSAFGIPDVWGAASEAIAERAAFHSSRLHTGDWQKAIDLLIERPWFKESVTIVTNSRIVNAGFEDGVWTVDAVDGEYTAKSLVVAQPPWQAMGWLPRSEWPAHIIQIASKTKPVSVVVLAEVLLKKDIEIPEVIIVPAERVQIVRNGENEICFQATIDFELSLQAPAVVKAVKQLKRARRKLLTLHPGLVSEGNHLALQPVAWAQSPLHSDKRWLSRLTKKPVATATLAFVGDAYGPQYDGDLNIVRSVAAAVEAIGASMS